MDQACYSGEHMSVWVPIGSVLIAFVCVGIPLMTFLVMWRHRYALTKVHVMQTYGFIYT